MIGYGYSLDTKQVVAEIHGSNNFEIEKWFVKNLGDSDAYGLTYTPAFGTIDGLTYDGVDADEVRVILQ